MNKDILYILGSATMFITLAIGAYSGQRKNFENQLKLQTTHAYETGYKSGYKLGQIDYLNGKVQFKPDSIHVNRYEYSYE